MAELNNVVVREAYAGTENKEDVLVHIMPNSGGRAILVQSKVGKLFDTHIREAAEALLDQFGISSCSMEIRDQNALDYVVRARVETAILRALEA